MKERRETLRQAMIGLEWAEATARALRECDPAFASLLAGIGGPAIEARLRRVQHALRAMLGPRRCRRHPTATLERKAFAAAPLWRTEVIDYCGECLAEYVREHGIPRPWQGPDVYEVPDGAASLAAATRWLR